MVDVHKEPVLIGYYWLTRVGTVRLRAFHFLGALWRRRPLASCPWSFFVETKYGPAGLFDQYFDLLHSLIFHPIDKPVLDLVEYHRQTVDLSEALVFLFLENPAGSPFAEKLE